MVASTAARTSPAVFMKREMSPALDWHCFNFEGKDISPFAFRDSDKV